MSNQTRTLYFECRMGAAGDMLTAALFELLDETEKKVFIDKLNNLGLDRVVFLPLKAEKCGIVGTHMSVTIQGEEEETADYDHKHNHANEELHTHEHGHCDGEDETHHNNSHSHRGLQEIEEIINGLKISEGVKKDAIAVYKLIAEAESRVHGREVSEIHFHEVGKLDAIADVTAFCMLIEQLNPQKIIASPIHVGSGQVRCAHGILPVPAPATADILKDVPIYSGEIRGELCTPTGAALLKYFVTSFESMPVMKVQKIGYGMGKKDFAMANCVRAMLGETAVTTNRVLELTCNLDDITPERIAFAEERLFDAGALEVYTVNVGMKKSRPGIMLCVMCREEDRDTMIQLIFKHTTTIGIRENISNRYTLSRQMDTISTELGEVRIKRSEGYGIVREKYEYEDLARIAKDNNMSIDEVVKRCDSMERNV